MFRYEIEEAFEGIEAKNKCIKFKLDVKSVTIALT